MENIIYVNKQGIRTSTEKLTGKQIIEKAGLNAKEYDLFVVQGCEMGGCKKATKISSNRLITIENGMMFNTIIKNAETVEL